MTEKLNKQGCERLAKAILNQDMGEYSETFTYSTADSLESAVSNLYQHFLEIADTHLNLLAPEIDPEDFVEFFLLKYIDNEAMQKDLIDISDSVIPVKFIENSSS